MIRGSGRAATIGGMMMARRVCLDQSSLKVVATRMTMATQYARGGIGGGGAIRASKAGGLIIMVIELIFV